MNIVTHNDVAVTFYVHWLKPLERTVVGHTFPDITAVRARSVDAMKFILLWLDKPNLDLETIEPIVRARAQIMLADQIRAMAGDRTPVPLEIAGANPVALARAVLRGGIQDRLAAIARPPSMPTG